MDQGWGFRANKSKRGVARAGEWQKTLGFRASGFGLWLRVSGFGVRVRVSGFGVRVRISNFGVRVRITGSGSRFGPARTAS
jgi:hypothetical protein